MSIFARKWPLVSILTGACFLYAQQTQHTVFLRQHSKTHPSHEKRTTSAIFLPLPNKCRQTFLFSALFPTAVLESSKDLPQVIKTNDNTEDNGIIEQSKANFLELQDQFVRIILTNVPLVEDFQHMNAADLRGALTNLWDTMTMADIIDSIKDVKDTVANPELKQDASVRFGPGLAQEEQDFLRKRMEYQRIAFASFIGVDPLDVEIEDIPIISVASSGGGYRAMLGLTGYLKAMKDSGALDCVTYIAAISGSCWALSLYYSVLTNCDPDILIDHLKLRVGTHIGNVSHVLSLAAASTQNATLLLQGIGQRYLQQSSVSLVDLFGSLIGATLYTRTTVKAYNDPDNDDEDIPKEEILLAKKDMKLSSQRQFFSDGSQPMPIYCVVRQDLEDKFQDKLEKAQDEANNKELTPEQLKELVKNTAATENKADGGDDDDGSHMYQWFEFTAYEFGSDEVDAWIPMWAFGRKFSNGVNTERLPEQRLDSLLGMFGSAFAASVVHFYQEIRSFLPTSSLHMADETIGRYQKSLSIYHPISPAVYPNPFYTFAEKKPSDDQHRDLFTSEPFYSLMDAGMDNNIPFYPLISQRKADIILAVDLSADIQTAPHFERAEGYVKRRGIDGWPVGAGWPKEQISDTIKNIDQEPTELVASLGEQQQQQQQQQQQRDDQENEGKNQSTENNQQQQNDKEMTAVDDMEQPSEMTHISSTSSSNNKQRYALGPCTVFPATTTTTMTTNADTGDDGRRLITLVYFPFIGNDNYDPDFDPQMADFCATWNFMYEPDQVEKVVGLAQANWNDNTDQVRAVFRAVWERKRRLRLRQRDSENSGNLFMYP
ncbi:acyl transferase/acyl hydrolase/lysophospholipase [Absidia repens]|uniref:Lysophospholipase n=1 Tax=Absidia repens TaxID=90262 RepID=A0A1X2J0Z0_9FUNG|nr:acyl transferase/acyl hydrolase/lysophospholipase [Absidia repens]